MPAWLRKKDLSRRCALLDTIRGVTVINMVLFHAIYDLVFIFGMNWQWYLGTGAFVWQQMICSTFIALSGFCAAMGSHTVRRGAIVFALGAAVTLVTLLFMPDELILFGVLTLIGSCMLLVGAAKPLLRKIPAAIGLPVCAALYLFTYPASRGGLGFYTKVLIELPRWLYHDYFTAYLGFPQPGFASSDYFSLIPWLFLFLSGFFLHGLCGRQILSVKWKGIAPLNFIGRHALEIYIAHQPVVYGLLLAWDAVIRPLFR